MTIIVSQFQKFAEKRRLHRSDQYANQGPRQNRTAKRKKADAAGSIED